MSCNKIIETFPTRHIGAIHHCGNKKKTLKRKNIKLLIKNYFRPCLPYDQRMRRK